MARDIITIEDCEPGQPVMGCGCEGITTDTMLACEYAILTPGDACPAGRCPECEGLVYLDRPEDRVRDYAGKMLEALRAVLRCPQAAPWLARLPMDMQSGEPGPGRPSVFDAARAVIAQVEGR